MHNEITISTIRIFSVPTVRLHEGHPRKRCSTRMKANGIQIAKIGSRAEPDVANFLYDSLHPQIKREVHKFAKIVS